MPVCACGMPTGLKSTQCDRCAALHALDLGADATEASIRAAYRMLIKVWHPDRFQNDSKLKQAAEEKLKEINSAYEFLLSSTGKRAPGERPKPTETHTAPSASAVQPPRTVTAMGRRSTFQWGAAIGLVGKVVLAVIVILLARYTWIAFNVQDTASDAVSKVYDIGRSSLLPGLEDPKRRFFAAVEQDLERFGLRRAVPVPAAEKPAAGPETEGRETQSHSAAAHADHAVPVPTKGEIQPYITVGLTKDEVIATAGQPTASLPDKLVYRGSEIDFQDDRVSGWKIDPAAPLRVKLWPDGPVDTSLEAFTVGSTRNEVLVVQGTPTAFAANQFSYGGSEVYFQNDRVVSWKNDPATIPLKVQAH